MAEQDHPVRAARLALAVPAAALLAVLAAGAAGAFGAREWLWVELALLAALCVAPAACMAARGSLRTFDLLHVFLAFFFLLYVAKPAYQLTLAPSVADIARCAIRTEDTFVEVASQAALVSILALAAFGVAFAWGGPRRFAAKLPTIPAYPRPAAVYAIVGVLGGVAVLSTLVLARRVGGVGWLLANMRDKRTTLREQWDVVAGMQLVMPAILLWVGYRMSPRFFRSPLNLAVLAGAVALLVLQGVRLHILFLVITTMCLWHWYGRPIRLLTLAAICVVGVVGSVFFMMYRVYGRLGWDYVLNGVPGSGPLHNLAWCFAGYDGFLDVLRDGGDLLPTNWGRGWIAYFLFLVPPAFRPARDLFVPAPELHTRLFVASFDPSSVVFSVSLLGDLYVEFSLAGIVLGMFAIGAGVAIVREWFRLHSTNRGVGLVYAACFPVMMSLLVEGVTGLLSELIRVGGPIAVSVWVLSRVGRVRPLARPACWVEAR